MTDEQASAPPELADGLATYAGLRGEARAEAMRRTIESGEIGSSLIALSMDFVFGRVWSRDGLDAQQRSLVTIAILIALRQPEELRNHIQLGLSNGLTARQIEEAAIQAAAYAGFPAAHTACKILREVVEDLAYGAAASAAKDGDRPPAGTAEG